MNDNGRVIFKVTTPDAAATVQSAGNLSSPKWTSLFTNTTANGRFSYTDSGEAVFAMRLGNDSGGSHEIQLRIPGGR